MSVPTPRSRARRGPFARFRKAQGGNTAVEFGIVAIPFFALMYALIEIGLVFFANFTLENAVDQAARLIRTGQAQQGGFTEGKFKEEVCKHVYGLIDCAGGLIIDVRKFDKFSSITLPEPLDAEGNASIPSNYDPGDAGDIVVVRAFYEWDLIASFGGLMPNLGLGNMANGHRLLQAAATFRNEPFK